MQPTGAYVAPPLLPPWETVIFPIRIQSLADIPKKCRFNPDTPDPFAEVFTRINAFVQ
jgi:hypothetical protein